MAVLTTVPTCSTGDVTRYLSKKALGDMSKERQVAKWLRMDCMLCLGCWRVARRYFCSGRESVGKMACAASNGLKGGFSALLLPSLILLMCVNASSAAEKSLARRLRTLRSYSYSR